jgi:UDP-N-acetylmuramoyl-L-alanyl-D-glutamate--2,6-diaminopimelate ligase
MMAGVAEQQADRVVVTSDNPRSEKPARSSARSCSASPTRGGAGRARPRRGHRRHAGPGRAEDVVLLAGKGHEAWQEIAGERIAFSDRQRMRSRRCDGRGSRHDQ